PSPTRRPSDLALVGDELGGARLLLAQLEPPAAGGEVRVALAQLAAVLGAQRDAALERALGVGVAGLELDVAPRRGHDACNLLMDGTPAAGGDLRGSPPCRSGSPSSSTPCSPTGSSSCAIARPRTGSSAARSRRRR